MSHQTQHGSKAIGRGNGTPASTEESTPPYTPHSH